MQGTSRSRASYERLQVYDYLFHFFQIRLSFNGDFIRSIFTEGGLGFLSIRIKSNGGMHALTLCCVLVVMQA